MFEHKALLCNSFGTDGKTDGNDKHNNHDDLCDNAYLIIIVRGILQGYWRVHGEQLPNMRPSKAKQRTLAASNSFSTPKRMIAAFEIWLIRCQLEAPSDCGEITAF